MKYMLSLILSFTVISLVHSQNLIKNRVLEQKLGYVNPSSSARMHLIKQGTTYSLEDYSCNLNISDTLMFFYTVNEQSDLIYFERKSSFDNSMLVETGYYRLVYLDDDLAYCWVKDLVWMSFSDKKLIGRKFFVRGEEYTCF